MNFESPYVEMPKRLTVRQNLQGVRRRSTMSRDIDAQIDKLAAELDLVELLDRPSAASFRPGQKTRVALAKALINQPRRAPARRADRLARSRTPPTGCARISSAIAGSEHATILLASHNMPEVERLCDDVLMMKAGKIVDRGKPAELIARYGRDDDGGGLPRRRARPPQGGGGMSDAAITSLLLAAARRRDGAAQLVSAALVVAAHRRPDLLAGGADADVGLSAALPDPTRRACSRRPAAPSSARCCSGTSSSAARSASRSRSWRRCGRAISPT